MLLEQLTPDLLNRAVDIYLCHAYPSPGEIEAHRVRFDQGAGRAEILAAFAEETDPRGCAPRAYVLRLGSEAYPHMKLALWEAYYAEEFVFAVDTHDGFRFPEDHPEFQRWISLKSENRRVKQAIEYAWYEASIPTLRRLKETAMSRTDCIREFSGRKVLLVDDDEDAAGIIRVILNGRGLQCEVAGSVRQAKAYIDSDECDCGLVLADVVLPDGSGTEVVRLLQARPETQNLPVVLSSAMSGSDIHAVGVKHYLRKPYTAEELMELVETILQQDYDGHRHFIMDKRDEAAGTA